MLHIELMTEFARDRRPVMVDVEQRMAQIFSADKCGASLSALSPAPSDGNAYPLREPTIKPELRFPNIRRVRLRRFALACGALLAVAAVGLAWWASGSWTGSPTTEVGSAPTLPQASPERPTAAPPYWDAPAAMLYVSQERDPPSIYRLRPDGTGLETVYAANPSDGVYIRGMAADLANGWLYVNGCSKIFRMRFDGTQREIVSPPESVGPGDYMTLYGSHLFFMDGTTSLRCFSISPESLQTPIAERRSRTLIDVFSSQYRPLNALVWDVAGQQFYWDAEDMDHTLWLMRWRGDETRPQREIPLPSGTRDLQYDYRRRILYWCYQTHIVQLDLTQASPTPRRVASPASKEIGHFAFDYARRRLYWTEVITGRVGEYNMDNGSTRLLLNDPAKFDHLREILVVPEAAFAGEAP